MINLHLLPESVCLFIKFLLFLLPVTSHLPPVPLALCGRRRHLGFLLAGFQLLSGLHHLAGVVLTGGAVPAWRAEQSNPVGLLQRPAPKTENSPPLTTRLNGGSGVICILELRAVKKLQPAEAVANVLQLKNARPVSLLLAQCHPGDSALPFG